MKGVSERPLKEYAIGFYDGPHATPPESSEGPIFLRLDNITPEGRLDLSDLRHIADRDFPRWTRRVLPQPGDVVVSYEATLHRYVLIPEGFHGCLGRRRALVRPNRRKVEPAFLLYYFLSPIWRATAAPAVLSGATVDRLSLKQLPNLAVRVPDLLTQRRIVNILAAFDDMIENNTRRMALLEQSARLLYEEWFVRLRFPGREHATLVGSPLGKIPLEWKVVTLGEIASKIGSGATPRGGQAAYQDEGITLIRSQNVYDYHFDDEGLAFLSESQAAELDNVCVEPGDVLLNITGASVARCCMAPERHLPARVNQHVMIIRARPEIADPSFVLCSINSDNRKRQLLSYAQVGSTREALTKEGVSNFQIVLPEHRLLQQFSDFARDAFRQRENLAHQNAKLHAARDLLLPRLMSGEVGV